MNEHVKQRVIGLCLGLLVLVVFWPATGYDFVSYDDNV